MKRFRNERGAGLIVLALIVLAISIMATTIVVSSKWLIDEKNVEETQSLLRGLQLAISSTHVSNPVKYQRSYEQDVGALPTALTDLTTKPAAVAACSLNTGTHALTGWCGPYWVFTFSVQDFSDAWGHSLVYNAGARTVRSIGANGIDDGGAGDDIVQGF